VRLCIIYADSQRYQERLSLYRQLAEDIEHRWHVETAFSKIGSPDDPSIERLKRDIRSVPPQVRGRIVSSRNFILPLSGTKNLNLQNTPILILYDKNGQAVDIYPHLTGTAYAGVEDFLQAFLERGPTGYAASKGILEDPIAKIVCEDPSMIEEGMKCVAPNVPVPTGVIDVLLKDKTGAPVVVEVETIATDSAVGQVCRLAAGYASHNNLDLSKVRKAIVARGLEGRVLESARGGGVEVYRIASKREV